MKSIYWLFLVSVAMFISGIGFVVASARTARAPGPAVETTSVTPVATIKQIMQGIVAPAAMTIFNSVSVTVTKNGTEEKKPTTDEEWAKVSADAAALVEAGNLLMLGNRAIDRGEWIKMTRTLMETSTVALRAAEAKDADALFASGEAINASCDSCHMRYQRQ